MVHHRAASRPPTPQAVTYGGRSEATNVLVYNVKKIREDKATEQIGQPTRRYTVIPLEEPVAPTTEPVKPPPPSKAPSNPDPLPNQNRKQ
jgi:hypothetical protein